MTFGKPGRPPEDRMARQCEILVAVSPLLLTIGAQQLSMRQAAQAAYRKGPESPSASAGGGMALAPCRCLAPVREGSWSTLPTESWLGVPTPVGNSTSGPWDSVRAARRLHNSPGLRPRTNPSTRQSAGPAGHRQGAPGAGVGLAPPVDGPPGAPPNRP